MTSHAPTQIPEPPIVRVLFAGTRTAWFWLLVRIYVGWEWLQPGIAKVGSPDWTGSHAGAAITDFVNGALRRTGGEHPDVTGWYATFLRDVVLPHASLWAHLVAWGEVLVGVSLILGMLTVLAAFFGGSMNVSFLLAGSVNSNAVLFVLATWLVMAWRVAGWYGADRWLLPLLSTLWTPSPLIYDRPPVSGRARPS
jgi:thiosulfate dehydrogenase [quinone] large subunit